MNTQLIKFFNVALVENEKMSMDQFKTVNELAAKVGYFVHPDVCNKSVLEFLYAQDINPNATFYQNWLDVTSKTRLELLFDQLFHYLTTYGTGFALGNGYVPNEGAEGVPALDYKLFKTIMPISRKELFEKCWNMLCSGVALKKETMEALADFVIEEVKNGVMIDVDEIKNREGQIYICTKLNIWPNNPTALFRMIMFLTTGNTLIVNNNETFRAIQHSTQPFNFNKLDEKTLVKLSSIFLRFKNLFLAFKHNEHCNNIAVINKLRKLAIKNHKPFVPGFWQSIFVDEKSMDEVEARMSELTNYKKVALMQTCLERIGNAENRIYLIRNGKMFLKENCQIQDNDVTYVVKLYNALRKSLVETLKANSEKEVRVFDELQGREITEIASKVIKVYSGMHVTMPSSEKSFIGNYPFGTSYDLTNDNFVCCYWRSAWGTHDYDLSLTDIKGNKYGWNAAYYNKDQNIIYSGDMTEADPEAAEVIKIKKHDGLFGLIKINQFRGESKSKFELLFGQTKDNFCSYEHFMVNPNDVKFRATIEHENKRELQVGLVADGKITLMEVHSGNHIVSRAFNKAPQYMEALTAKSRYFVDAVDLLKDAGYTIVDENYTGEVDIDMANLEKDSLISLMV